MQTFSSYLPSHFKPILVYVSELGFTPERLFPLLRRLVKLHPGPLWKWELQEPFPDEVISISKMRNIFNFAYFIIYPLIV